MSETVAKAVASDLGDKASEAGSAAYDSTVVMLENLREAYPDYFLYGLIAVGVLLVFFGLRLFKPTLGIIAGVVFWIFRSRFIPFLNFDGTDSKLFYVAVGLSVAIGLLAWYLVDFGILIMGLASGGVCGYYIFIWAKAFIFALIAKHFEHTVDSKESMIAMFIVVAIFAVVGAYLVNKMVEAVMISCSAFLGSFIFVNSVGAFIGSLPNWERLPDICMNLQFKALPAMSYLYILAVIILCMVGAYYQYKNHYGLGHSETKKKED